MADGLVGVGLITQSEDNPGLIVLDKGHSDMSKFLNRILGIKVELQNLLFKYFSDTLAAVVSQAKRNGSFDQVPHLHLLDDLQGFPSLKTAKLHHEAHKLFQSRQRKHARAKKQCKYACTVAISRFTAWSIYYICILWKINETFRTP